MGSQTNGMLLAVALSLAMWLAVAAVARGALNAYAADIVGAHGSATTDTDHQAGLVPQRLANSY